MIIIVSSKYDTCVLKRGWIGCGSVLVGTRRPPPAHAYQAQQMPDLLISARLRIRQGCFLTSGCAYAIRTQLLWRRGRTTYPVLALRNSSTIGGTTGYPELVVHVIGLSTLQQLHYDRGVSSCDAYDDRLHASRDHRAVKGLWLARVSTTPQAGALMLKDMMDNAFGAFCTTCVARL